MIDDAGEDWIFKHKFDFIHARELHCAVPEERLMQQAYEYVFLCNPKLVTNCVFSRNLEPGGWLELQELSFPVRNDDMTLTQDHAIYQWSAYMLEASRKMGRDLDNPERYPQWMNEAGFINVTNVPHKWPSNPWPRDKKHKTVGLWNQANTLDGLEGFSMAIFTRVLGWTPEEVTIFLIRVREDTKNRKIHNYWPM
jgi:hypothetical protein